MGVNVSKSIYFSVDFQSLGKFSEQSSSIGSRYVSRANFQMTNPEDYQKASFLTGRMYVVLHGETLCLDIVGYDLRDAVSYYLSAMRNLSTMGKTSFILEENGFEIQMVRDADKVMSEVKLSDQIIDSFAFHYSEIDIAISELVATKLKLEDLAPGRDR